MYTVNYQQKNEDFHDQAKTGFWDKSDFASLDAPYLIPSGGVEMHAQKWVRPCTKVRGE